MPAERTEFIEVSDKNEVEIYREVRPFLRRTGAEPRGVTVDPTGGKMSMLAAVALAGFLEGAKLIYVDYGQYDPQRRIPVAGSEYPRLLMNPLEVLGDVEIERIHRLFDGGSYAEAAERAAELAGRLYMPREAEALEAAARAYGAWDGFQFKQAKKWLDGLAVLLERHAAEGLWSRARAVEAPLQAHRVFVDRLAPLDQQNPPATLAAGAPLILNHLSAARRALDRDRLSLAGMLSYSTMEKYVDLCLLAKFGLDDENPDYERIAGLLDMKRYEAAERMLFGRSEQRPLQGSLQFANGLQLLAALAPERVLPTSAVLGYWTRKAKDTSFANPVPPFGATYCTNLGLAKGRSSYSHSNRGAGGGRNGWSATAVSHCNHADAAATSGVPNISV